MQPVKNVNNFWGRAYSDHLLNREAQQRITFMIMKDSKEQKKSERVFWIGLAVMVIFTVLLEYNIYSENKLKEANTQILQQEIKHIREGSKRLEESHSRLENDLAPVKEFIFNNYPNLSISGAIKQIETELATLKKQTKKTTFTYVMGDTNQPLDDKFQTTFTLIPLGENIIPILSIECTTYGTVRIYSIGIDGKRMPPFRYRRSSIDETTKSIELTNVIPQNLKLIVTTDEQVKKLICYSELLAWLTFDDLVGGNKCK